MRSFLGFANAHDSQLPSASACFAVGQHADIIGVSATIPFDSDTAIALADRFCDEAYFFLLESATPGPGGIARYSFCGFDPLWVFNLTDGRVRSGFRGEETETALDGQNPLKVMQEKWESLTVRPVGAGEGLIDGVNLMSLAGATGYIGYEVAGCLEPSIGKMPKKNLGIPSMLFHLPRNFFVLDQLSRKLTVVRFIRTGPECSEHGIDQELSQMKSLLHRVQEDHRTPELKIREGQKPDLSVCGQEVEKASFLKKAESCLEEISKGEIFQVQIGNRLSYKTSARPFDLFRHLRILNPSPYMVFYKFNDHHIICASPEMMVNVVDRTVMHRPIAGTRKRTWHPARDRKMKDELQSDIKERAEHVMLVDLSRNDIGRIADPGSVQVNELMVVEEYSHVFHLVSEVEGRLRKDLSAFDAMSASFPNGTVTGAPKVRAMEIINELETCAREFYAGSLGMFNLDGQLRSTLLIRTMYVSGGVAYTQASAGIVYDSVPEMEWKETLNKMAACLVAMQFTE